MGMATPFKTHLPFCKRMIYRDVIHITQNSGGKCFIHFLTCENPWNFKVIKHSNLPSSLNFISCISDKGKRKIDTMIIRVAIFFFNLNRVLDVIPWRIFNRLAMFSEQIFGC